MRTAWSSIAFLLFAVGCGSATKPSTAAEAEPLDPGKQLYERLRSGAYSLDAAVTASAEAVKSAKAMVKEAEGEPKQTLLDVLELLDGVGAKVDEFAEAPKEAEVSHDFAKYDETRLHAIDAATEALHDLGDAMDGVQNLQEGAPDDFKKDVNELADQVGQAKESVTEAISQLGGKTGNP